VVTKFCTVAPNFCGPQYGPCFVSPFGHYNFEVFERFCAPALDRFTERTIQTNSSFNYIR